MQGLNYISITTEIILLIIKNIEIYDQNNTNNMPRVKNANRLK